MSGLAGDPLQLLARRVSERQAEVRAEVASWARSARGIVAPEHPLIASLSALAIAHGRLDELLGWASAAEDLVAVCDVHMKLTADGGPLLALGRALELAAKVPRHQAMAQAWRVADQEAIAEAATRLAGALAERALADASLSGLAAGLEALRRAGLDGGIEGRCLRRKVDSVLATAFSVDRLLLDLDACGLEVRERRAEIERCLAWLRHLHDLTGSSLVETAMARLAVEAPDVWVAGAEARTEDLVEAEPDPHLAALVAALDRPGTRRLLGVWLEDVCWRYGPHRLGAALESLDRELGAAGPRATPQHLRWLLHRLDHHLEAAEAGGRTGGLAGLLGNVEAIDRLAGHGLLTPRLARELRDHARATAAVALRAEDAYSRTLDSVMRAAHQEGRSELHENERSRIRQERLLISGGVVRVDLEPDLKLLERRWCRELKVATGWSSSGLEILGSHDAQVRLFGQPLLEALRVRDGRASDPFPTRFRTAWRAACRFLYEAGGWAGVKHELYERHRPLAAQLFEVRQAWARWVCQEHGAVQVGTIEDIRDDCDLTFLLGSSPPGAGFVRTPAGPWANPVSRLREADRHTAELVRQALASAGLGAGKLAGLDHRLLLECGFYVDPCLIHLYTRLPESLRPQVIRPLTGLSVGLARHLVIHFLEGLPQALMVQALSAFPPDLDRHVVRPEDVALELDVPDWDTPQGQELLLDRLGWLLDEHFRDLQDPAAVLRVCQAQMLVNARIEGAYPTPGAALVTVSIKEGRFDPEMARLRRRRLDLAREVAALQRRLLRLPAADPGLPMLERRLAGRLRTLRAADAVSERRRLEAVAALSPDEALQSAIGDMVFFWHLVHGAAGREEIEAGAHYELAKYVTRLLEVAKVFGVQISVAGSELDRLLAVTRRIYDTHDPAVALRGPAFCHPRLYRRYFERVQAATEEVVRHLAQRSSLVDHPSGLQPPVGVGRLDT